MSYDYEHDDKNDDYEHDGGNDDCDDGYQEDFGHCATICCHKLGQE